MRNVRIIGTGHHVPQREVTNDELAQHMDTSDQWIRERSGIETRRWIQPGETSDQMCVAASRQAIEAAGIDPMQIDMIICATITPDCFFPGNSALLQHSLGVGTVAAMDIRNQCTGFVYGVSTAAAHIKAGIADTVLLVGAEIQSTALDLSDRGRDMSVLFGDGAGAAILQATDTDSDLLASSLHSQGEHARELWCEMPSSTIPGRINAEVMAEGRHHPHMNGRMVFKHAIKRFCEAIQEVLDKGGLTIEDVALVVPHQANLRITEMVAHRFKLKPEQVVSNIQKYGNTTAASIPIALDEAVRDGRLQRGDNLILVAFGSGFTLGANLIRW
jgi:3-oxoacyl-[acyl-carrier-protein] synthase III